MDIKYLVRSLIFLIAGLATLFYPKNVYKFQTRFISLLHLRFRLKEDREQYKALGIIFIIISVILFLVSMSI